MNIEAPNHQPPGVNLANVDLNLLTSLHALLEEGSVTAAAQRVGLSQPAMSHALRRIRRLFDDEILIRRGSRNVLTPKALELIGPLRDVVHRTTQLLGGEPFRPEYSSRTLTIAMSSSVSYILGRSITHLLEQQAPRMKLRTVPIPQDHDTIFTTHGADVLLLAEGYESDYPRERLFDDEWVVIGGTPEFLESDPIMQLQDWPHVALDTPHRTRPYEVLLHRGIDAKIHVRVDDYLLLPRYVAGVHRVGLQRRRVIEQMARTDELYTAKFPFPILGLGVDMVWNPWLGDEPYKQWVRALLTEADRISQMNDADS
ncbi:LysR family transcriptional regulator [Enteractinococcus helveticum]|uniref:LysR family transcriptional regulator n=2 Tax=Enteractinococcus helveticum TaxID=1837282 RepID=A0A1B7M154_9MICC|nr:LysR family transcriptional regulator [Enteractinococcus helveticum]